MKQEFVSSVYILSEKGILLIHHRKLGKWTPPGGHVEKGELSHIAAIREAKEETGLDVELIDREPIEMNYPNAKSLPSAYMTLWHPVDLPCPHEHINFVYIARPIGGLVKKNEESSGINWFSHEEMQELKEEEIYQDTIDTMSHLFSRIDLFPKKIKQEALHE